MNESCCSFLSVNVRLRPAQKTRASTGRPHGLIGVMTVIAVALPSTFAMWLSLAPRVLREPGPRLPSDDRAEDAGGAEHGAAAAECLARPAPEREGVDVLGDERAVEAEARLDVVDDVPAGPGERVARRPARPAAVA